MRETHRINQQWCLQDNFDSLQIRSLPPGYVLRREGTVFTWGVPHFHAIILPTTGPMPFPGGTPGGEYPNPRQGVPCLGVSPWPGPVSPWPGLGYPLSQDRTGVPPPPQYRASTCYMFGDMLLAFRKEEFLVWFDFNSNKRHTERTILR